jgi:transposase InsO family protein
VVLPGDVVDACSRRLLGWSITDHLRTELCLDALLAAVAARGGRRRLPAGIVFHTDHGTQGGSNWSSQHLDLEAGKWGGDLDGLRPQRDGR